MDILTLIIAIALIGFVTWIVTTYVPMPAPIKQTLVALVVILIIVWLVRALVGPLPVVRVR